ncbi:unnamed protein product, partial [Sphenostylis stenocarpa]
MARSPSRLARRPSCHLSNRYHHPDWRDNCLAICQRRDRRLDWRDDGLDLSRRD